GRALQLTNILRDLEEDAGRDRLYLPAGLLRDNGVPGCDPDSVLDHPGMVKVWAELAEIAQRDFDEAAAILAVCDRNQMRPAILMMEVYRRIFAKLMGRGWRRAGAPVTLSKVEKLWVVLRYGVF
ncbi:MAG: squalene/phytoene synthase family protein, partial [Rhodospirillales bacterium]